MQSSSDLKSEEITGGAAVVLTPAAFMRPSGLCCLTVLWFLAQDGLDVRGCSEESSI